MEKTGTYTIGVYVFNAHTTAFVVLLSCGTVHTDTKFVMIEKPQSGRNDTSRTVSTIKSLRYNCVTEMPKKRKTIDYELWMDKLKQRIDNNSIIIE